MRAPENSRASPTPFARPDVRPSLPPLWEATKLAPTGPGTQKFDSAVDVASATVQAASAEGARDEGCRAGLGCRCVAVGATLR
jgi:hypothetical protein